MGGHGTTQRVFGRLKEEVKILPISSLPTLTPHLALREDSSGMDDGTIMVQGDYSLTWDVQKIFSLGDKYSTHGRRWWPLMHTLAKFMMFWMGDSFPWKTNLQKLQPLLEHEQLQEEKQREDSIISICEFAMGDVKEGGNHMIDDLHDRLSMLSLWRIDPYWKSQLLVDYSKYIFTCMILDDQLLEEGYQ